MSNSAKDKIVVFYCEALSGDRNMVVSTKGMTFSANSHARFAYALIIADNAGYCPRLDLSGATALADTAFARYWNPSRFTPAQVGGGPIVQLSFYPNPAQDMLFVRGTLAPQTRVLLINALGATVNIRYSQNASGMDVQTGNLVPGLYHIRVLSDNETVSRPFIKL